MEDTIIHVEYTDYRDIPTPPPSRLQKIKKTNRLSQVICHDLYTVCNSL